MSMIDVFKQVKRFFKEDDIYNVDIDMLNFEFLGYDNKEDFLECIKPMKYENIYTTSSPIFPFMYCDFENSIHLELFDLSKAAITTFVQPEKRIEQLKAYKGSYRHLYFMMQSNMKALDFVKNYKKIPRGQLSEIFLDIYQSMDFSFDVFPDDVINDIFSLLKEENNNNSEECGATCLRTDSSMQCEKLVRIYRGQSEHNTPLKKAYSWTTSKKIAKFFANRFETQGTIYRGYIKECDIVHRDRDGEFEVLCRFKDVQNIEEIE